MSTPIKVSELNILTQITADDYIIVNDSASLSTRRSTISTFGDFLSGSNKRVGSSSYSDYSVSSSYALSASYSLSSSLANSAITSSYSHRTATATYVIPAEPLSANVVNMVGTSSWAVSASHVAPSTQNITASYSRTASYLQYSNVPNGTASYSMRALVADIALNISSSGSGISGTGIHGTLTKWSGSGNNQPLVDSGIWDNGSIMIFTEGAQLNVPDTYTNNVNLASTYSSQGVSYLIQGGHVYLSGSWGIGRGQSNRLYFAGTETTDYCFIQFSSSYRDGSYNNGNMIFVTADDDTEPFIFKTKNFNGVVKDRMIIRPDGPDDTYVDLSGSMFVHTYLGVGELMSETGIGAMIHISASAISNDPMFITETPTALGMFVSASGQVGIGTTNPRTRLETIGSFSSPEYYVKSGTDYLKGISGTWIVFNTSDPNGFSGRTYLTFNNGILVNQSAAPALPGSTITGPVTPPDTDPTDPPASGGGGGCPATWQLIETLEYGYIPAEQVVKGMHLKGIDGWNLVFDAETKTADIWRIVVSGETYDVDESHLWMIEKNTWKKVVNFKKNDLIMDSQGNYVSVDDVFLYKENGTYRHLSVDRKSYVLGNRSLIGHNGVDLVTNKN